MPGETNAPLFSLPASADISALQFCAVAIDTSAELEAADGVSSAMIPVGLLQNKPTAQGKAGAVQTGGKSKAKAKAAFSVGADLTSVATSGRLQAAVTTDMVVAIALEAATADGDIVEVLIVGPYESTTAT